MSEPQYYKHLALLLDKAQGVIDAETGIAIDVGHECGALRDECDRMRKKVEHYERDLNDGHADRSQDTDWLRAGFLQRGAEIERLEDRVRALAQIMDNESAAHYRRWCAGASQHYEGRSDQAAEDAERLLKLLPD